MASPDQTAQPQQYVPTKRAPGRYPLIDNDPHFRRVVTYARPHDWTRGAALAAAGPIGLLFLEKMSPSRVGKGGFASVMRLVGVISLFGGFFNVYARSSYRFYGATENERERQMDMREMVEKVKKGEPLYGESTLSPYMQGVAARNSRYATTFLTILPWFNFVNHNHHGVDTAKYYQAAERELAAEDAAKAT